GGGDLAVRPALGRRPGHRGRGAGGGAGDAVAGGDRQPLAAPVRAAGERAARTWRRDPCQHGDTRMSEITIYHNPRCGTSRNTLAMIRNSGEEPIVIEYLQQPPTRARLLELADASGVGVRGLLRAKEPVCAELGLDDPACSDDELVDAMLAHPVL